MLITSILGLALDKQKALALIMILLSGAWAAFIGVQIVMPMLKACL